MKVNTLGLAASPMMARKSNLFHMFLQGRAGAGRCLATDGKEGLTWPLAKSPRARAAVAWLGDLTPADVLELFVARGFVT